MEAARSPPAHRPLAAPPRFMLFITNYTESIVVLNYINYICSVRKCDADTLNSIEGIVGTIYYTACSRDHCLTRIICNILHYNAGIENYKLYKALFASQIVFDV